MTIDWQVYLFICVCVFAPHLCVCVLWGQKLALASFHHSLPVTFEEGPLLSQGLKFPQLGWKPEIPVISLSSPTLELGYRHCWNNWLDTWVLDPNSGPHDWSAPALSFWALFQAPINWSIRKVWHAHMHFLNTIWHKKVRRKDYVLYDSSHTPPRRGKNYKKQLLGTWEKTMQEAGEDACEWEVSEAVVCSHAAVKICQNSQIFSYKS